MQAGWALQRTTERRSARKQDSRHHAATHERVLHSVPQAPKRCSCNDPTSLGWRALTFLP